MLLFGAGPGLNLDLAMSTFQVPNNDSCDWASATTAANKTTTTTRTLVLRILSSSLDCREQLPHTLGQHGGFVDIVTGFQARWAIAVKNVDGKTRGTFGRDQYAAEGARHPERVASGDWVRDRHLRAVIVAKISTDM